MTHLRFLALIITRAIQGDLWDCDRGDIYSSKTARCVSARIAIVVIAYRFSCTPDDIVTAFRWPGLDKRYNRIRATARHGEFLRSEVYQVRFHQLERYAREITGGHDPEG